MLKKKSKFECLMSDFKARYSLGKDVFSVENECYEIVIDGMDVDIFFRFCLLYIEAPIVFIPKDSEVALSILKNILKHSLYRSLESNCVLSLRKERKVFLQAAFAEQELNITMFETAMKEFINELEEYKKILNISTEPRPVGGRKMIFTP